MKENTQNQFMVKKIQDSLMKLISEEYFAYQLYTMSRFAVCPCGAAVIDELFSETAEDELDDHLRELVKWCREYGYEIPCSETEFRKYADKQISRQAQQLKKDQPAGYYIDEAIKSEQAAIASYKKALEIREVPQFTDLQSLLWHIYYDEAEHLEKLNTAKIAFEAGDSLVM